MMQSDAMITVRNAEEKDLPFIIKTEIECFSSPWPPEALEYELKRDVSVFLIASVGGEAAGYISGENILGDVYINNIAVSAPFRRRGVASALLREFLARNAGASFVSLEVRRSNTAAISLYEKSGFIPVGERKNYYSYPLEDALIYTLFI